MRTVCLVLLAALGSGLRSRVALQIENAALRHQLAVLQRQARGRPRLRPVDRLFWTWLCRLWPGWRHAVVIVTPDTVLRVNVTGHPTAAWTAQQIRNAFPWDTAPRFLLRDRDGTYGPAFRTCLEAMAIDEVLTAPHSPWQNPYVERLIGSMRRACLDHVIVWNERSLRGHLQHYLAYYHE